MDAVLDIVVPFMDNPGRLKALSFMLSALSADSSKDRVEVIVAGCRGPLWCPARTRNAGAALGRAPWVMFLDGDMVIQPGGLIRLVDYVIPEARTDEVVCLPRWYNPPYTHIIQTIEQYQTVPQECYDAPYSQQWWDENWARAMSNPLAQPLGSGNLYGPSLMSRAHFEALGRWDEDFEGWGGEDDEFLWRARRFGSGARSDDSVTFIQLPHPRDVGTRDNTGLLNKKIGQ